MSKVWAVKVTREIEEPFFGHMIQDERPTDEELLKWLSEEHYIDDNPDYTKYEVWEVK